MEESYRRNKKVTDEFIWKFSEKYDVCMPDDILFNFDIADFFREILYSTRIYPEGQKVKQEKEFNKDRTQKDKI